MLDSMRNDGQRYAGPFDLDSTGRGGRAAGHQAVAEASENGGRKREGAIHRYSAIRPGCGEGGFCPGGWRNTVPLRMYAGALVSGGVRYAHTHGQMAGTSAAI